MNFGDQFTNVRKFFNEGIENKNIIQMITPSGNVPDMRVPSVLTPNQVTLKHNKIILIVKSEIYPIETLIRFGLNQGQIWHLNLSSKKSLQPYFGISKQ